MSERIITLFGEEIVPEQGKPAAKNRGKKKADDKKEEEPVTNQDKQEDARQEAPIEEITNEPATQEVNAITKARVVNEENTTSTPEVKTNTEQDIQTAESGLMPDASIPVTEQVAVPEAQDSQPMDAELTAATAPVENTAVIPQEGLVGIVDDNTAPSVESTEANAPAGEHVTTNVAELPVPEEKKKRAKKEVVKPEEPTDGKQYYTIGEVADMFKVKTSHIRFWTTEFNLKVRTTRKGDRLYNNDHLKELRAIHHLVKERGFTLSGAKAKLKEGKKKEVETVDLKKSLHQLRNMLVTIKNQLK